MESHFLLHFQPSGALLVESHTLNYFRLSKEGAELALLISKLGSDLEKIARVWSKLINKPVSADDMSLCYPNTLLRFNGQKACFLLLFE